MTQVKQLVGDSMTSAELWLLPVPLALIAEGGLTDVQSAAVALCYVAFVGGRVAVKRSGVAAMVEQGRRAAPLLLAGLALVLLPGCAGTRGWLEEPAEPPPRVLVTLPDGTEHELGPGALDEADEPYQLEVPGVGTVEIRPDGLEPPATKGDQVAEGAGAIVGMATGSAALGLLAAKLLGGVIGSRRRKAPQVEAEA